MKQTQIQIVKGLLEKNSCVTRNECLSLYISRLSAIVQVLETQGYKFTTKNHGGDFVYTLADKPVVPEKPRHEIKIINGEAKAVLVN